MTTTHRLFSGVLAALLLVASVSTLVLAQQSGAPPAGGQQTLPGGASQMQETHGDWRVVCAQPGGQKECAFSQQLADPNTRQLVAALELKPADEGKAAGTLVLPFGLAVEKPLTLRVDEGASLTARIRTCLPVGCVASVDFDAPMVKALRSGTLLTVNATADGGKETSFRIGLKGFASAMDRTAALAK